MDSHRLSWTSLRHNSPERPIEREVKGGKIKGREVQRHLMGIALIGPLLLYQGAFIKAPTLHEIDQHVTEIR